MYDAIVNEIEKLHIEYYKNPYKNQIALEEILEEISRLRMIIGSLHLRLFNLENHTTSVEKFKKT